MQNNLIITSEILNNVAKYLVSLYNVNNSKALIRFIEELDSINTLGCFTKAGVIKLNNLIYNNPSDQETRLEILQNMYIGFLQEGVKFDAISMFVADIYFTITADRVLAEAYLNTMPVFENSMLETYGSVFLQMMMLRVLRVKILELLTPEIARIAEDEILSNQAAIRQNYLNSLVYDKEE